MSTNIAKLTSAIIVDDDDALVKVFEQYLKLNHIDVLGHCYDGLEAVALYEKLRPDVVLLDIMMPHHDGFYALEKIKENDPDAKVIAVTADLTEETEKKLQDLKVSGIIYKPYDMKDILKTIEYVNNQTIM
jgi:two-component system, chemotaxis family, chemotaxis protein CheY